MLTIGEELHGRYKIEALLGEGGMGAVYRASDWLESGRLCAIKEFRLGHLPSQDELNAECSDSTRHDQNLTVLSREQALEQFRREAKLLKQLDHPNLPKVFDYFSTGTEAYIVMTLIEGRDLVDILLENNNEPLDEPLILSIFRQILSALKYCHENHVIHRDIKPDNIILSSDGTAYLVDFGIAKDTTISGNTTTIAARAKTPEFSPPEQGGEIRTDERSDIYSLGSTIFMLCTGKKPVTALDRSAGTLLVPVTKFNPKINPQLALTIERCMQLDRNDRYRSVEEIQKSLSKIPSPPGSERKPEFSTQPFDQSISTSSVAPIKKPDLSRTAKLMLGFSAIILLIFTIIFASGRLTFQSPASKNTNTPGQFDQMATNSVIKTSTPNSSLTPLPTNTLSLTMTPTIPTVTITTAYSVTPENIKTPEAITRENLSRLVSEIVPWQFNSITDMAFSPDGEILAIADYGSIMLYKGSKYEYVKIPAYASQVGFSPDGKLLITYEAGSIKFREISTLRLTNVCKVDPSEIKKLVVFPTRNWVAATGYYFEPYIEICDYTSEIPILYLGGVQPFTSLAVSKDGERLAAGSEKSILVWNNMSKVLNQQPAELLKYSKYPISNVAFSEDGEQVISGGSNGEIITWSISTMEENLSMVLGSGDDIQDIGVIPGSNMIFSISRKNAPFFFDLTILEKIHEMTSLSTETIVFTTLATSPNSNSLAVADDNGAVYIIHLP